MYRVRLRSLNTSFTLPSQLITAESQPILIKAPQICVFGTKLRDDGFLWRSFVQLTIIFDENIYQVDSRIIECVQQRILPCTLRRNGSRSKTRVVKIWETEERFARLPSSKCVWRLQLLLDSPNVDHKTANLCYYQYSNCNAFVGVSPLFVAR